MANFKKVAVIGKGMLGSAIVEKMVDAGFSVTIITRNRDSPKGLPSGVVVVEADYSSVESLATALADHDVAVSTVAFDAIPLQKSIIDASIKAGVKRFIPSDYASFNHDPIAQETLPFLRRFTEIYAYLDEKAQAGLLEYTVFSTGLVLDVIFFAPIVVGIAGRTATRYDDGKHHFRVSRLSTIGDAFTKALERPDVSKNRLLTIRDAVLSQDKIFSLVKRLGSGGWTETKVNGEIEFQKAVADAKARNDTSMGTSYNLIGQAILSGQFGTGRHVVDKEVLGLGYLSDEELEALFALQFTS
ncbi:NmrA-like family protein [Thozetella sp. PMI_491]|nr:NmrA-like family protein [Thozetella sp. PMI_491]